jgi:hypothetical protein
MAAKKNKLTSGRLHESLASDEAAAQIGKYMDERAALVETARKKRRNAEAHVHIAQTAEQESQDAVRVSVRFLAQVAEEVFPKATAEARATLTAALISAYGAGLADIHLKLGRATGMFEDVLTHLETMPEFAKHTV